MNLGNTCLVRREIRCEIKHSVHGNNLNFLQELLAAVKSNTKKVIVLKKGQLKLYAGQPFADVEKALLSFVEHNYGASTRNLT